MRSAGKGMTGAATALLLAASLQATAAMAEHPGALWSVSFIKITAADGADAAVSKVRTGLSAANETYFYGDQAVRMDVHVHSPNAMEITLRDQLTGTVVGSTGPIALKATPQDVARTALAWMETLECAGGGCAAAEGPVLAAVPLPTDSRAEKAPTAVRAQRVAKGVPIPAPRPQARPAQDEVASVTIARNPDARLRELPAPVRISRLNTDSVGDISYSEDEPVVLAQTGTLAPAPQEAPTAIGRLFDRIVRLFGFADPEPELAAVAPATTAQPATRAVGTPARVTRTAVGTDPVVTSPISNPGLQTAQPPAADWRPNAVEEPQNVRVASLDPTAGLGLPASSPPPGIRVMPSPGLRLPPPWREPAADLVRTPVRLAPVVLPTEQTTVRLSPEVLAQYTPKPTDKLFDSYGNSKAKVRLVAAGSEPRRSRSVENVLQAKGVSLDETKYADAHRVYWTGNSGSRGFWVNIPGLADPRFVLVAGAKSSVIARVHNQGSTTEVSDAVAAELGMAPGAWSDIQVIAVKQTQRASLRRGRRVTR